MNSVIFVASRPFLPVVGGRERMINQSVRFLFSGTNLRLVVFFSSKDNIDREIYEKEFPGVSIAFVKMPGMFRVIKNLVFSGMGAPLQTSLFRSSTATKLLRNLVHEQLPDCIIFDMLRTSAVFDEWRGCKILEMDDLLSKRYQRTADPMQSLGTFQDRIPGVLRRLFSAFSSIAIRYEKWAVEKAERRAPAIYNHVFLVSNIEANELARVSQKTNISAVPQSITKKISNKNDYSVRQPLKAAFLGNLRTKANIQSLEFIVNELMPELKKQEFQVEFHIFGPTSTAADEIVASSPEIVLHGFVSDLEAALSAMDIAVAPMWGGTGVKSKVVDCIAFGLPMITTAEGVSGLSLVDGVDVLIASDASGIARKIIELGANEERRRQIGSAGAKALLVKHDESLLKIAYLDAVASAIKSSPNFDLCAVQ